MSASGPKQTSLVAPHMSAGKADMAFCGSPLSRSLLGAKRTSLFAAQMSPLPLPPKGTAQASLRKALIASRNRPKAGSPGRIR